MSVKIGESRADITVIKFGPDICDNPTGRFKLYHWSVTQDEDGNPSDPIVNVIRQGPIPRKGRLTLKLPLGERHLIMIMDGDSPVLETTAAHSLMTPFFVTIDAVPEPVPASNLRAITPLCHAVKSILGKPH